MVREGVDFLIRVGTLPDSDLAVRMTGSMAMGNLASPAYLRQHGTPTSLDDLAAHQLIHYAKGLRNEDACFRFLQNGTVREIQMKSALALNSGLFLQAACQQGLGIIQLSMPTCQRLIDRGELVKVLPDFRPPPVKLSFCCPTAGILRHVSRRCFSGRSRSKGPECRPKLDRHAMVLRPSSTRTEGHQNGGAGGSMA